ncbi:hypothetical protein SK128_016780, partial [Halocaridina rubra]
MRYLIVLTVIFLVINERTLANSIGNPDESNESELLGRPSSLRRYLQHPRKLTAKSLLRRLGHIPLHPDRLFPEETLKPRRPEGGFTHFNLENTGSSETMNLGFNLTHPPHPRTIHKKNKLWNYQLRFQGKIEGECLAVILRHICFNSFTSEPQHQGHHANNGPFSCESSGCKITTLLGSYCPMRQMPDIESFSSQQITTGLSYSANNNLYGPCARYVTQATYNEARGVGWNCFQNLQRICLVNIPIPKGKHHQEHESPFVKILMEDIHHSLMSVAKKEVLTRLLRESYNELTPKSQ